MSHIWTFRGTRALLFASLAGIAAGSNHGHPHALPQPEIHIRLTEFVPLPEKLRTQAEARVVSLFGRAGVRVDFVECASAGHPCQTPPGPDTYWVQLLDRRPLHLGEDSAGFAVLVASGRAGDSYAAVSFPMVEEAAREMQAQLADVLAASLAHEIGHLVLHSSAHSPIGLMKPRLDRRQIDLMARGELAFTSAEAIRMAERIGAPER